MYKDTIIVGVAIYIESEKELSVDKLNAIQESIEADSNERNDWNWIIKDNEFNGTDDVKSKYAIPYGCIKSARGFLDGLEGKKVIGVVV